MITSLYVYYNDGSKFRQEETITKEQLTDILNRLKHEVICMSATAENGLRLELEFGENDECFLKFCDEKNKISYYYDNGCRKEELVDLCLHEYQKRWICESVDKVIKIATLFFETGQRAEDVLWIKEENPVSGTSSEIHDNGKDSRLG